MAFLGHTDPWGFALRISARLRDPKRDAGRSFVLIGDGAPLAGAHVQGHAPEDDDQSLGLTHLWFEESPDHLRQLVEAIFDRYPHESVYAPLHGVSTPIEKKLGSALTGLGFRPDEYLDLRFDLSEVPPLGMPLVLEAWSLPTDGAFRDLYQLSEETMLSDRAWAWLKRWRGPFLPDLWFIARETLDQEPVGFAFCGTNEHRVDASYYLTAVDVLPEHRHSSEMLRRLVVSTLLDLGAQSPLGRIETSLSSKDPKLIDILRSLGFEIDDRYRLLVKLPS